MRVNKRLLTRLSNKRLGLSRGKIRQVFGERFGIRVARATWGVYEHFKKATHQQCNAHLINRCNELLETAVRGAVHSPAR